MINRKRSYIMNALHHGAEYFKKVLQGEVKKLHSGLEGQWLKKGVWY